MEEQWIFAVAYKQLTTLKAKDAVTNLVSAAESFFELAAAD